MTQRRAFITGASRGIGQAIAERYAREGYDVVAPQRRELDLSSTASIEAYVARNASLAIDVLVNDAGENKVNPIADIALADWERMLTLNLTAAFLLTQAFAPGMAARKWGRVVNISSFLSILSRAGRAAYIASKAGLNGFTRTAAVEYGEHGVLVNAVCPGFVETAMTKQNNTPAQIEALCQRIAQKRMAQPDEIAGFAYYLGSEQNTYVTGQTLVIDGGYSCQ